MKRPSESDYTSHVAYTRALEAYCDEKREWVGLTDEDFGKLCADAEITHGGWARSFIKSVEAKLKEKNT